jgi:hypothetical protein
LYLSFEAYAFVWGHVRPYLNHLALTRQDGRARLVCCVALSLALGLGLIAQIHSSPNAVSILLAAAHGVFIHLQWEKGLRWCKRKLGILPNRYVDPQRPFAGLDLGN